MNFNSCAKVQKFFQRTLKKNMSMLYKIFGITLIKPPNKLNEIFPVCKFCFIFVPKFKNLIVF
jgi:anthranilate phosphoribosyltransferase